MTSVDRLLPALAAIALLAAAPAGRAQTTSWYAVEMIVFAHPGGDARDAEAWRPDPGGPDTSRAVPVAGGDASIAPVSPTAYRLSGVWQALRNSAGYRPLRHLAWTQAGRPEERATQVLVGDEPGAPVHGVVQVSRARFLHIKVDLVYEDGGARYRFTTRRKMRSNELH